MPARLLRLSLAFFLVAMSGVEAIRADPVLYYSSDEAGFQGPSLGGRGSAGFVLAVTASASQTVRTLYKDGLVRRRTVITVSAQGSLEEEYENGSLAETRRYDRSGNILEERFFSPPEPSAGGQAPGKATEGGSLLLGYFVYSYADDRLSRMEAFDPGAHVVGSMTYRYDPQGRLLEVRAAGSLGDSRAGMTPGSGLPAAAWTSIPDDTEGRSELTRYDRAGRPVERSRYLGKTGLSVELLAYSATGLLVSSREYVQASGTITETTYDPAGRASLVVVLVQGLERSRRSFSYDDESRLVEDTLVTESCTTKVLHEYGREGELERATTSIDGVTVLVVTSLADGSQIKEFHDRGEPFLRALYVDGRLRKEEFLEGGSVVRMREYP